MVVQAVWTVVVVEAAVVVVVMVGIVLDMQGRWEVLNLYTMARVITSSPDARSRRCRRRLKREALVVLVNALT